MEIDLLWLGLGLAAMGYFIGDGLKNFKNPSARNLFEEADDDHALIHENEVHHIIGISNADTQVLLKEHPEIPHITVNNIAYYSKGKLLEWLKNIE
ncbi:DNA-binding protein [Virgibacillus halodenitrificans]|uniref:DNA-binding protein n=1 Tax=Virgibacillus halodenitrificans TaxID=1482 RepID=A0ABR7VQ84_VIRHA|nr:DNA-binding protein [Virgibacillus halodenitrificans]MBD1224071.1 DNA-binding protein [Virgibacillus halodenitrificans]MEC2160099.1 DNA-binding protein [Virgibacillus halodenitrificans]